MALLFARQPIFNLKNRLYGYELLYREDGENTNTYTSKDGDAASSNVMAASFLSSGFSEILGKKKIFINFTESMLLHQVATLFPREQIIVEVLENIEPSEEIIYACRRLKAEGYTIALDDFVFRPGYGALIEIADIIKVDFMQTITEYERKTIVEKYKNGKRLFLAEKIETREEFQMAVKAGYRLFQGYYFSKPIITSSKGIPPSKMNYFNLIKLLEKKDPKFEDIARVIEKDVGFSYEILRIANSSYYFRGHKVFSVRQAAVRMGLDELKKWAFITVLRKIGGESQDAVVNFCAQRAKTLELLCQKTGFPDRKTEFFTLGILSMIDVLAGCSMDLLLPELPISGEAKQVLKGIYDDDKMSVCYQLMLAYEKGEWSRISELSEKYEIGEDTIFEAYYESMIWTNTFELN